VTHIDSFVNRAAHFLMRCDFVVGLVVLVAGVAKSKQLDDSVDSSDFDAHSPQCLTQNTDSRAGAALIGISQRLSQYVQAAKSEHARPLRPLVYIYDLPSRFRESGTHECAELDCAFGGPPVRYGPSSNRAFLVWQSSQFYMPWMIYHRLLKSSSRTHRLADADVFFVPAWSVDTIPCTSKTDLLAALQQENPAFSSDDRLIASRHIFIDSRARRSWCCGYMRDFRGSVRVNLEMEELDNTNNTWFGFPYPTLYHGPSASIPARTRPGGFAEYLWSCIMGVHGSYRTRRALMQECLMSPRCYPPKHVFEDDPDHATRVNQTWLASVFLSSTFCVEPMGDSPGRKGLVDSIVMGCIPVLFDKRQLALWPAHVSPAEMRSMSVFIDS